MELNKDIYEYLTNFADNRTILNMLSVNRKFNDEQFFKRVMQRKYPLLLRFQKKDESVKSLFVRMAYALAKLEEDYGIPYISTPKYNPYEFYIRWKRVSNKEEIYNQAMDYAVQAGELDIVKSMIEKGATEYDWVMDKAIKFGHLNIIQFLMNKINGKHNTYHLMIASEMGNLNVVKYLLKEIVFDIRGLNKALVMSSSEGYTEIVRLLVQSGATDLNTALTGAALNGQLETVKYLAQQGATSSQLWMSPTTSRMVQGPV